MGKMEGDMAPRAQARLCSGLQDGSRRKQWDSCKSFSKAKSVLSSTISMSEQAGQATSSIARATVPTAKKQSSGKTTRQYLTSEEYWMLVAMAILEQ